MGNTSSISESLGLEQNVDPLRRTFGSLGPSSNKSKAADFGRTLAFGGFYPDRYSDWLPEKKVGGLKCETKIRDQTFFKFKEK